MYEVSGWRLHEQRVERQNDRRHGGDAQQRSAVVRQEAGPWHEHTT